eukprot:745868-Hanusia_phi.AAC.2
MKTSCGASATRSITAPRLLEPLPSELFLAWSPQQRERPTRLTATQVHAGDQNALSIVFHALQDPEEQVSTWIDEQAASLMLRFARLP